MNDESHETEKGLQLEPKACSSIIATSDEDIVVADLYIDPVAENKLLVKLDLYIAPVMTLIFLAAYLDRSNIGNAASAGMTKDLNLKRNQLGSKFSPSKLNKSRLLTDSCRVQMR
jgi:hypothetical protein